MKVNDMKLLILSDTHRSLGFAYDAIEKNTRTRLCIWATI